MKKIVLAIVMAAVIPAAAQPAGPAPAAESAPTETVKVTAPKMPDAVITNFVKTYTAPSLLTGKIPRWAKGGICLQTQGLARELEEAVTNRILEVASEVGAPVQKQPCTLNVAVLFDRNPQSVMDDIAANHEELLGPHEKAQVKNLATVRHQIQAWYATGTRDDKGVWTPDIPETAIECDEIDTQVMSSTGGNIAAKVDANKFQQVVADMQRYCGRRYTTGNRLRDGLQSEFGAVTVVAAVDALNYHQLSAVADYIALLVLSQTQAFDTCQGMASVANLLVPGCDPSNRIDGLTDGDMAFLKALYHADNSGTLVAQQAAIADAMKKTLPGR